MNRFQKILKILHPQLSVGGLEISNSYLRFVVIREKKIDFFSVKLPPGVIEGGKIKDRESLILYLKALHSKITHKKNKKIYVIVGISDANIYTSIITLPLAAISSIDEAAYLNLQMVSPIDFNTVYADWQRINNDEVTASAGQIEILGVFAPKEIINEIEKTAEEVGFVIAAIEFPALSLARVLTEYGENILRKDVYLCLKIGSDGLTYEIIKTGNLYFMHFVSWATAFGENKKIEINSFKNLIVSETKKVLNFHENHISDKIEKIFIVAPGLVEEIVKLFSEQFPSIKTEALNLQQFKQLSSSWFSALGLALRGLIPRSDDNLISLASVDTDVNFKNYQIISFINFWRNIIFTTLGTILIAFIALNIFLSKNLQSLNNQIASLDLNANNKRIAELSEQALEFNKKVDLIYKANLNRSRWSKVLEELNSKSEAGIVITHLIIPPGAPITLFAEASNENKITAFQNELKKNQLFEDIQLPLSSISQLPDGRVSFNISFKIK